MRLSHIFSLEERIVLYILIVVFFVYNIQSNILKGLWRSIKFRNFSWGSLSQK